MIYYTDRYTPALSFVRPERNALATLVAVVALVAPCFAQAPPQPLTLQEAVDMALSRNPEVLVAQEQLTELDGRIKEVRSEAYPQIRMEGFGLRVRDPSILNSPSFDDVPQDFRDALVPRATNLFDVGISVTQPLYNAGKVGHAVRLAEQSRQERIAALEAVKRQVVFKVFQAFRDLQLAFENELVVRETYQQRLRHLELARSRFALGVATEIDVLRSEVNAANTEPDLIRAASRIRLARATLNNLIVVDLEFPTQISGRLEYRPWSPFAIQQYQDMAREARPELEAARHQLEQARTMLALANSEKKPSIDLEGRWGYSVREMQNFLGPDYSRWNLTFNFKLPFYDGGRKAGLVAQALSRMRAAEHNLAQIENSIQLEIKAAYDDLESSAKAFSAAQLSVVQAEKVLTMMQANYQNGAATTLDVVDSQTALVVARNTQIRAIYDFEMARARLHLASGSPIVDRQAH